MKAGRIISLAMLAVYLVSICGSAAVVLSCHCSHSHYIAGGKVSTCGCHSCLETAMAASDATIDNGCSCIHDHSTDIDLYSADDYRPQSIVPTVSDCIITPADEADIATRVARHTYIARGNIPLPCSPHSEACGLRAPPVFA